MPLFDLRCPKCAKTDEHYIPMGESTLPKCTACQTCLVRDGIGMFRIRAPAPTGATLKSGEFVRGTWGGPRYRVKRRIKTFA